VIGRFVIVVVAIVASGCGARTGVLDEEEGADAGHGFGTLPCRWTLGRSVELARPSDTCRITGAVHDSRDEVVLAWDTVDCKSVTRPTDPQGARLVLGDPPAILGPGLSPPSGSTPMAFVHGELWQLAGRDVLRLDDGLREVERVPVDLHFAQAFNGTDPDILHGVVTGEGLAWAAWSISHRARVGSIFNATIRAGALELLPDRGWVGVDMFGAYVSPIGEPTVRGDVSDVGFVLSAAPDRLRGGLVAIYRGSSGLGIARLPFALPPALAPLAVIDAPAEPVGALVTNETEALVALDDGRVLIEPLSGSAVRYLHLNTEMGHVSAAQVLLRPGTSVGGVVYVERDVVQFQTLVCNR